MKISPAPFKDVDMITPIYSGAVARAANLKLILGSGKNLFHPKDSATRAEAAVVIDRLLKQFEKENQNVVIQPFAVVKENSIEFKLSINNNTDKPVTFTHSSGQKYDFVLLDYHKNELYRWSEDKAFTMMITQSVIEPGKSLEYKETLDGEVYKQIKDKIAYLKAYVVGSSEAFSINPDGYEIKIK